MNRKLFAFALAILWSSHLCEGNGKSLDEKRLPNEKRFSNTSDHGSGEKANGPESIDVKENEQNDAELHRRSSSGSEVVLSSPHDSLRIVLNMGDDTIGRKRASFIFSKDMWTHRIPYIMEFKDATRRMRLRKVLDEIEDNLCVRFYDVEGALDSSDPQWLKEHGYKTNAYIRFHTGSGCVSSVGIGSGKSARKVSPCYNYFSMKHETMHALGAIHEQKMPGREKYLTVHFANIREGKHSQYQQSPKDRVNVAFFDPASTLLYGPRYFHNGPGDTYSFLRPDMKGLVGSVMSTKNLYYEMNQNYKCKETFCSDVSKDCGPGYLTFVHDKCVCICPDQYDPDTNCTTQIDKVEGPKSWPHTPFSLLKAGECPDGFTKGKIPLPGEAVPKQTESPFPLSFEGKTLNVEVCTKRKPTKKISWNDWPDGSFCIGKVSRGPCGVPFLQSSFEMMRTKSKAWRGSVGDVTVDGRKINMKFCCNGGGPRPIPMRLPTTTPFGLIATKKGCQEVEGMFPVMTRIDTELKTSVVGFKPKVWTSGRYFTYNSCLYIPPVYGCNNIFKLNASQRTVTFSIPKKGELRAGSRRCFYAFQVPLKSRLRLTFNTFSIHPEDRFLVKRFHPWTNPFRVESDSRPTQIITERNYLFVEFWSYYLENDQYKGADLTVDILLDDEMCYDANLRGSDYVGDKSVSELYEECVPWNETTSCPDFPNKYSQILKNSGNKCRNLDEVEMLQPWCYIKVEGAVCERRYCDVCNEADPIDLKEDCQERIDADPNACSSTLFRKDCFKSCGANSGTYDYDQSKGEAEYYSYVKCIERKNVLVMPYMYAIIEKMETLLKNMSLVVSKTYDL